MTLDRAIELAREAVAEKGFDYVYANPLWGDSSYNGAACCYELDGACSCVVGDVVYRAGGSLDLLRQMDKFGGFLDVPQDLVPRTDDANWFLRTLQSEQDCGTPWGVALEVALEEVGRAG